MSSAVQNLMQQVLGDGARASKFEVIFEFTNPSSAPNENDVKALVKTTSLPSKSHQTIDLKYKGRSIPIKGQTKYSQTWECSFYLTQDHQLKHAFENWIEAIDEKNNYMKPSDGGAFLAETQSKHYNRSNYTTTIKIHQRDFDDSTNTASYTLFNVFPTEISPVSYSQESTGQIQEFTVTFAYSYFTSEVNKGKAGNFVDNIVGKITDASKSIINGQLTNLSNSINSFVKDAAGDTLNKLNAYAKNFSVDVSPIITPSAVTDLISGGVSPSFMGSTSMDEIKAKMNDSFNSFNTSLSNEVNSAITSVKKLLG